VQTPYLTSDIPGTGGVIRRYPEDFFVQEIPLYEPSGEGPHTYLLIEKRGISTFEAIHRIASAMGTHFGAVGYAGLKDTRALTVQRVSVEGIDRDDALALQVPGIQVLEAEYHRNKLRIGHLAGNRFRIRIRQVRENAFENARKTLDVLSRRGVSNFFGMQRFSARRNAHLIGRAMILGRWDEALRLYLGSPQPQEQEVVREARRAFDNGELDYARRVLPLPRYREERRVLGGLLRGLPPELAFMELHGRIRRLFVSAYQSALFNRVLAARCPDIGTILDGDLAMKHQGGAVFRVVDAAREQQRADAFDISPSGPLFGADMMQPEGQPRAVEDQILRDEGFEPHRMATVFASVNGQRRHLRVPLAEPELEREDDGSLVVSFRLPSGSYATVVLDEIMKTGAAHLPDDEDDDDSR
jgi:tRNA pseudouridine13 synthase